MIGNRYDIIMDRISLSGVYGICTVLTFDVDWSWGMGSTVVRRVGHNLSI